MRTLARTLIVASLAGVLLCPHGAWASTPSRWVLPPAAFARQPTVQALFKASDYFHGVPLGTSERVVEVVLVPTHVPSTVSYRNDKVFVLDRTGHLDGPLTHALAQALAAAPCSMKTPTTLVAFGPRVAVYDDGQRHACFLDWDTRTHAIRLSPFPTGGVGARVRRLSGFPVDPLSQTEQKRLDKTFAQSPPGRQALDQALLADAEAVTLPGSGRLVVYFGWHVFVVGAKSGLVDAKLQARVRTEAERLSCDYPLDLAPAGEVVRLTQVAEDDNSGACTLALRWDPAKETIKVRLVSGDPRLMKFVAACTRLEQDNEAALRLWHHGRRPAARRLWLETWSKHGPGIAYDVHILHRGFRCRGLGDTCGNVGFAMFKAGDLLNAAAFLSQCDTATALLNMGDAYTAAGWTGDAIKSYTQALEKGLVDRQRARAKAALAKLRTIRRRTTPPPSRPFTRIWGAGRDDVFAVGQAPHGRWKLYRTRDQGRTWKVLRMARDDPDDPHGPRIVGSSRTDIWLVGERLWHSRGDGASFSRVATPSGSRGRSLYVSPAGTVFVRGAWRPHPPLRLFVSRDHGAHWHWRALPSLVTRVDALNGAGRDLYVTGTTRDDPDSRSLPRLIIMHSSDGGRHWDPPRTPVSGGVEDARRYSERGDQAYYRVVAKAAGAVLVMGETIFETYFLARSPDHGRHWSRSKQSHIPSVFFGSVPDDVCAWNDAWLGPSGKMVAVGPKDGCPLCVSTDYGAHLRLPRRMPPASAKGNMSVWGTQGAIFVAGKGGVFLSTDGGMTWQDRTPR